jgi:hypothetical protein
MLSKLYQSLQWLKMECLKLPIYLPSVDYHCPTKQLVTNVFVFAQRSQRKGGHADAMGQVERTYSAASQATCSVLLAPAEHFTEQVVRTGHNRHGRPRRATQHPPCSAYGVSKT